MPMEDSAGAAGHSRHYDAFISYSHEGSDRQLSAAIQRGLHRLAKPWYGTPAVRVFRDDTSLSANAGLWPTLERALVESKFFIVVASPRAADSEWVDREVSWWVEHKSLDRILIALANGSIVWDSDNRRMDCAATDALPPALWNSLQDEPFWIDLTWAESDNELSLQHPKFRDAVARLAAPLHGKDVESLVGEDLQQQRRATRWRNAAIAVLSVLTLLAGALSWVAVDQRNTARAERDIADARRLAAQAIDFIDHQDDLAQLLSLESVRRAPTAEGWGSVQQTLSQQLHRSWQLAGHTQRVNAAAFSSEGSTLATASSDTTIRLWDVERRATLGQPLEGHLAGVLALAFHPDRGKHLLVSGSADGSIRIWSTDTATTVRTLTPKTGSINAIAFNPDGSILATGSEDGTVQLWSTVTWEPAGAPLLGHEGDVYAVTFRPDGRVLATSGQDSIVRLWDIDTRQLFVPPLIGHSPDRNLNALAFSSDGQRLASAGEGGELLLWDAPWTKAPTEVPFHDDVALTVAFHPAVDFILASAGVDGVVRLWDTTKLVPALAPITGHVGRVNALAFRPDGGMIATAGDDTTARLWESVPRQAIGDPLTVEGGTLVHSVFNPKRAVIATSGDDTIARLWDSETGDLLHELRGHTENVEAIDFSPDGRLLATGSQDLSVRLWHVGSGKPFGTPLMGHTGAIADLAFSPRGDILATAGADGTLRLWQVDAGKPIREPIPHEGLVLAVKFSPDGAMVATAGPDTAVRMWDVSTGKLVGSPFVHSGSINDIDISADGQLLAAGGPDGVMIWNSTTREVEQDIPLSSPVMDVGLSPDRRFLAVAMFDGTVRLWSLLNAQPFGQPFEVDSDAAWSVAFSSDGTKFAASGINGTTKIYPTPQNWIATSCRIVGRNLTREEWERYLGGSEYIRNCGEYPAGLGASAESPIAVYPEPVGSE
jgi:WD40 repeat protein